MTKDANSISVGHAVVPSATCESRCQYCRGGRAAVPLTPEYRAIFAASLADQAQVARAAPGRAELLEELMKRRKFISAVPAAILLAQRPSVAIAQTREKGVMLMNRIGPSSSELCVATADGRDQRRLTDRLWEDAMPFCTPAKVT